MSNYYELLGVEEDATTDQIKAAYRKKALQYHPDKNPGDAGAEAKFKEFAVAFETLSNAEKRQEYDDMLAGRIPHANQQWASGGMGSMSMDEILRRFGDLFEGGGLGGGGFGGGFGGFGARRSAAPHPGRDVETELKVPFITAAVGGEVDVTLNSGSGEKSRRISIKIPAGVEDGSTLRLRGLGEPGVRGGAHGDLLVQIRIQSHPGFSRKGNNIISDLQVPVTTAALGGKLPVTTLRGEVVLTIPPGTSSGRQLRLKGQGIGDGDHLVRIQVTVPSDLSDRERELYEEIAQIRSGK